MQFLKKGLFEKDFMQTKIKSNHISTAEKWLGYGLGPGLAMVHLDKKIPQIRADLEERKCLATEARGEVYVSPEEQDRIEMEKAIRELEENRIADLKAKCDKKGLDFDTENRKYLEKVAKKGDKKAKKAKIRN